MFGVFKTKSKQEKLTDKYNQLMKKSFELSKTNRSASDEAYAEANKVMEEIENLENSK